MAAMGAGVEMALFWRPQVGIEKGGVSQQLYYHDCSGTESQVTPQGHHR